MTHPIVTGEPNPTEIVCGGRSLALVDRSGLKIRSCKVNFKIQVETTHSIDPIITQGLPSAHERSSIGSLQMGLQRSLVLATAAALALLARMPMTAATKKGLFGRMAQEAAGGAGGGSARHRRWTAAACWAR